MSREREYSNTLVETYDFKSAPNLMFRMPSLQLAFLQIIYDYVATDGEADQSRNTIRSRATVLKKNNDQVIIFLQQSKRAWLEFRWAVRSPQLRATVEIVA